MTAAEMCIRDRSYQELGIEEYIFLGGGCEICQALNGQAFKLSEAEAGVNLPPIHPNCKCTTRAKPVSYTHLEVRVCFRLLQCRRARIVTKRMLDGSVKRYTEVRKAGG